jgi:hypothetical protein
MRSKAWLAARVSLRLARLPRTASSAQRSRRLRSTRAAAPVLLAHAEVTKIIIFSMSPKLRYPKVHTNIHTYVRTNIHTYVRTYIHTYIRTYKHECHGARCAHHWDPASHQIGLTNIKSAQQPCQPCTAKQKGAHTGLWNDHERTQLGGTAGKHLHHHGFIPITISILNIN